jgi:hypothetical protein
MKETRHCSPLPSFSRAKRAGRAITRAVAVNGIDDGGTSSGPRSVLVPCLVTLIAVVWLRMRSKVVPRETTQGQRTVYTNFRRLRTTNNRLVLFQASITPCDAGGRCETRGLSHL